jgi:D-sedoheptulose 7-phosphate isomerase
MIFVAGNGGLCAESEHFAAELMGKYAFDVFIPCISLTSNTSLITALANDIGYENVFSHQLEVMGKQGDTFIGLTTSHSKNIRKAVEVAKKKGMKVILLDGDTLIGNNTAEKQEYAIKLLHRMAYDYKQNPR